MANTVIIYQGDGSTTDFAVPFDYLRKTFVRVFLDETTELTGGSSTNTSASYYFLDDTTIRLRVAPTSAQTLTVRRYTSVTERVASFRDGSVLYATDLDVSQLQAYHIAEEARDILYDSLTKDVSGNWDAKNKRIKNVATPIDDKDATNKSYVDTKDSALDTKIDNRYNTLKSYVDTQDQANRAYTDKIFAVAKTLGEYESTTKGYRDEAEKLRDESSTYALSAQASASIAVEAQTKAKEYASDALRSSMSASDGANLAHTYYKFTEALYKENSVEVKRLVKEAENYSDSSFNYKTLAQRWATQTSKPVEGDLYGAKYYAEKASESLAESINTAQKYAEEATESASLAKTESSNASNYALQAKEYAEEAKNASSSGTLNVSTYMETRRNAIASPYNIQGYLAELIGKSFFYFCPYEWRIASDGTIRIPKGTYIEIGAKLYYVSYNTEAVITPTKKAGKDFYIYAVTEGSDSDKTPVEATFVVSENSTVPDGYDEETSRKIGGYHCLCVDVGTIDGHPLSGYKAGDVLPNSLWDLWHRPVSDPEGMVYDPTQDIWVDIYLAYWNGSKLTSEFNTEPVIGGNTMDSNFMMFHGERFNEEFLSINKELPTRQQFISFANGAPYGESSALTYKIYDSSTGGNTVEAFNRRDISNIGVECCTGSTWQWLADTTFVGQSAGSTVKNVLYDDTVDEENYGYFVGTDAVRLLAGYMYVNAQAIGRRSIYAGATPGSPDIFNGDGFPSARGISQPLNKWANKNRYNMS